MGRVWSSSASPAWPGFLDVPALARGISRSLSRWWPSLVDLSSSSSPSSSSSSSSSSRWWWPTFDLQIDLSMLDSVIWPLVVAVESVALASMLCFFFLFCGCNI